MITDYFVLAIRNIRKRQLRSWLTMLGIFISIAAIFVLISLSLGFQSAVQEQFRLLGTDKIFIMPLGSSAGPGSDTAVKFTTDDIDVIKKISGVKDVSYFYVANGEVEFDDEKRFFLIAGLPTDSLDLLKEVLAYKADEGRMLKSSDSGKVMLGSQYKYNAVFKKPVRTGDSIKINGVSFKVETILQSVGNAQDDRLVYMFYDDFKKVSNVTTISEIIIQVDQGQDIEDAADRIEKKLLKYRGLTEKTKDFAILTPEELLSTFSLILNIITGFLSGVAAISLLVGAIGIANTMYTSVLERTKEIGIMKAVGAQNKDILLIFLIESGLLGLVGGAIGVLLGMGLGKTVEYIAINQVGTNLLKVVFPLYLIIGCLAFAFIIGAVSGTWPAYRASKIKPVDALHYE